MKSLILSLLLLLLAPLALAQDENLNFAIRESFIKCYAEHWKGSQTVRVENSPNKVELVCSGFWKKFNEDAAYPNDADEQNSPFKLSVPNQSATDIPFSVWSVALEKLLTQSSDNPMSNPR